MRVDERQPGEAIQFQQIRWPAPANVRAVVTHRNGGVSVMPFASFNLASHVGDDPTAVSRNRALLRRALKLPSEPVWLNQVHGVRILNDDQLVENATADGAITHQPGVVLAVLTADCLPIFLANCETGAVGVLHAGWRGLAAGIIEAGVRAIATGSADTDPPTVVAAFGPAISRGAFEVGDEVRERVMRVGSGDRRAFSEASAPGKWYADIYALARNRLNDLGVSCAPHAGACTVGDHHTWFSYRGSDDRAKRTGRMASLIWREGE